MFGRLFGGRERQAEQPALPVVRNVTVGRSVVLDPLAWRRFGDALKFKLDRDTLEVTAQGRVELGDGSWVHRFYTDDHLMLQAVSHDPAGQDADDFTLFQPWSSAWPSNRAARDSWLARLRRARFTDADLPTYDRLWFEGDTADQDPVSFREQVFEDRTGEPTAVIWQTCMLYARPLGPSADEGRELLLAIEQEVEGGDVTDEIMLGVPLSVGEFRA